MPQTPGAARSVSLSWKATHEFVRFLCNALLSYPFETVYRLRSLVAIELMEHFKV